MSQWKRIRTGWRVKVRLIDRKNARTGRLNAKRAGKRETPGRVRYRRRERCPTTGRKIARVVR